MHTISLGILALATFASGLLAGVSTDKSLVQLPARHQLGVSVFAAFSRAADLGRGLFWYPLLGIGAPVLVVAATILQIIQGGGGTPSLATYLAAGLAMAHLVTTSRAAPLLLRLQQEEIAVSTLQTIYRQFAHWQAVRGALQVATFAVLLWALSASHV